MLIPKKDHRISAQLPSPVRANINISRKGSVSKRYSISEHNLELNLLEDFGDRVAL